MKQFKIIFPVLIFILCTGFSLKSKGDKPVYVYGVSISFTDSVVYYTPIQTLDSVYLDKNNFLPDRSLYSYQLKTYLEYDKKLTNRTCMIYFSESKKKITKELNKMLNRYTKSKDVSVLKIEPEQFQFKKPEE